MAGLTFARVDSAHLSTATTTPSDLASSTMPLQRPGHWVDRAMQRLPGHFRLLGASRWITMGKLVQLLIYR